MLSRRFWWIVLLLAALLLPKQGPITAQVDTDTPIKVWWPDALYTETSRPVMDDLFVSFNNASNTQVNPRIYLASQDGRNIVDQLNLINTVAPNAMPDIMLLRRDDMIILLQQLSVTPTATDASVYTQHPAALHTLTVWDTLAITNEFAALSASLINMGQNNDTLYGLPYLVEIQHILYQPTSFDESPATTQDLLSDEQPLLFAGRPAIGQAVNDFVLTLYINAGGSLINAEGVPALSELPLRQTLNFVEEASAAQLLDIDLLAYRGPQDYLDVVIDEESPFTLLDSSLYLANPALASYTVAPIPAINETTVVLIDGWVWVLVTDDPIRQAEAYQFVRWMFETDQMVDIAMAVDSIPVQERALNAMNDPYYEAIQQLLADTVFVRGRRNQAAVALQTAFEAVLNGASAEEAATTAVNSLVAVDAG